MLTYRNFSILAYIFSFKLTEDDVDDIKPVKIHKKKKNLKEDSINPN
jgi:hypothetical protein